MYSQEPADKAQYTQSFNAAYTRFAALYDLLVRWTPVWRRWISQAVPEIRGPRVLEISFGTGYLLTQYSRRFETWGIDYNRTMASTAGQNLRRASVRANLLQADAAHLPLHFEAFDSVVNTMAFTGYPDGRAALLEMRRVLKPGGRIVMVDINYPADRNWAGMQLVRLWMRLGDLIRDMGALFETCGFRYTDREVGGSGSVHLYVATRL